MVDWEGVDLIVFDVDGTLYDQARLRRRMIAEMLKEAARSRSLRHLRIIRTFRACREGLGDRQADEFIRLQFELTARRCGVPVGDVQHTVAEWIERRPLPFLEACRIKGAASAVARLRMAGKVLAVFSDYRPDEKLLALKLPFAVAVSAEDADVAELKPSPAGLHKILAQTGVPADRALMIGDRFDRDWLAAQAAGMKCLIRSRSRDPRADTFKDFTDPCFRLTALPEAA